MMDGIIIRDLVKNVDERGYFAELLRQDWRDLLGEDKVVQLNLSYSYPKIVRAWHRHLLGQVDYFICIEGAIKVCAYDDREGSKTYRELDEIVLSEERLRVARIPGVLWHGYQSIGVKPIKLVYGVNCLYDSKNPDEERRPWNDLKIVPKSINGKRDDPRVGTSWDWYSSPNK